jgi:flagellar biosynthesis chaperone FliJ
MEQSEKYPLEQIAVIKQKRLEEAEKILLEKKQALIKEQEKLKAVEAERDEVKTHKKDKLAQLRGKMDEGAPATKIQQMKQYLKVVDEQLKQKELKVQEHQKLVDAAEKQVESARQNLFKRQKDVEKVKIHRQEWEKEQTAEQDRQDAIETDELGSAMHTSRKRGKIKRKD